MNDVTLLLYNFRGCRFAEELSHALNLGRVDPADVESSSVLLDTALSSSLWDGMLAPVRQLRHCFQQIFSRISRLTPPLTQHGTHPSWRQCVWVLMGADGCLQSDAVPDSCLLTWALLIPSSGPGHHEARARRRPPVVAVPSPAIPRRVPGGSPHPAAHRAPDTELQPRRKACGWGRGRTAGASASAPQAPRRALARRSAILRPQGLSGHTAVLSCSGPGADLPRMILGLVRSAPRFYCQKLTPIVPICCP